MEELIDILDETGRKTGESLPRNEVHKKGLWHRAIVCAIINEKNEILLQQRSFNKEKNAGMWDISVAGHISAGQDSLSATQREIKEEVNVDSKCDELQLIKTYKDQRVIRPDFIENQIYDFYILRKNGLTMADITVQESEVEQIAFVDINSLNKMVSNRQVVERDIMYSALYDYFTNVKETNHLKPTLMNKNNYSISNENVDKIKEYIE